MCTTRIENGVVVSNLRNEYLSDYNHYKEYRELIIDGQQSSSDNVDKLVLTLSSASLGLIITFLGKILTSKDISIISFWLLEYGLYTLISSLLFVIISMLLSTYIYQKNGEMCNQIMSNRVDIIDALDNESDQYPDPIIFSESTRLRRMTLQAHYLSPALLIIGIALTGSFFIINTEILDYEENTTTSTSTTFDATSTVEGKDKGKNSSTATAPPKKITTNKGITMDHNSDHQQDNKTASVPPPPPPPKAPENNNYE